jgi:hypothetical protein
MKFYFRDWVQYRAIMKDSWKQYRSDMKYSRMIEKKENEQGMIQCYLDDLEGVLPDMEEQQIKLSLRMFLHFYGMVEDKHPQDIINETTIKDYCKRYGVEFP